MLTKAAKLFAILIFCDSIRAQVTLPDAVMSCISPAVSAKIISESAKIQRATLDFTAKVEATRTHSSNPSVSYENEQQCSSTKGGCSFV